jgi:glycosyltransferase involved in cell wall biosynthesis
MNAPEKIEKFILYQGAVNEGRCFETLIPAMKDVKARLFIYGDGNFLQQAKDLIIKNNLSGKVILKGKVRPEELTRITASAWIGVTLFENSGLSNYFSLGNRFFDYIHAGVPQLCVDFPAYREINNQYRIAVLLADPGSGSIAKNLNSLLEDEVLYSELQQNCLRAKQVLNWQEEEKKLLSFYKNLY